MKVVGILPASGSATRINGIPKFCLPINEKETLLNWHISQLENCVDEIRIVSREIWKPFIPTDHPLVSLIIKEPSTMTDAVYSQIDDVSGETRYIVGMPDTYVLSEEVSMYEVLLKEVSNVALLALPMSRNLQGKVGQIHLNSQNQVLDIQDKNPECDYKFMWGAFSILGLNLDPTVSTPSLIFNQWIEEGIEVKGVRLPGEYIDAGSYEGLINLYGALGRGITN